MEEVTADDAMRAEDAHARIVERGERHERELFRRACRVACGTALPRATVLARCATLFRVVDRRLVAMVTIGDVHALVAQLVGERRDRIWRGHPLQTVVVAVD